VVLLGAAVPVLAIFVRHHVSRSHLGDTRLVELTVLGVEEYLSREWR